MTKRAFNKIMRGLLDARAYLDGTADKSRYRVHYAPRRSKAKRARPLHPGEVLREEFLVPLRLSAGALAKVMGVPRTRVERIAAESIGITADTALRLGKALGTSAQLWLNLQNRYDMETAERAIGKQLARISRVKAA
jgi:antitoxin HigA-1